ncbi:MAG TPA: 2OG-Fe(II) oxygenase family protein [Hyphomonadaceae bacterium]|nr:2OG-Fe(II) oxygenase family protein [Hyphomonadaceae bacterium]
MSKRFAEAGRLQIEDFLELPDARELAASLEGLDWRLVLNSGARHVDLPPAQLAMMGEPRLAAIREEVRKNAAQGFQYIYDNWPVADIAAAGQLNHPMLKAAYETMNSAAVRGFLEQVTGEATDFCDMQATRYSAGHFLTIHTDDAANKNRKLAYVLGLTDGWSPTWGGQLQFLDAQHRVTSSYVPRFNALSVFRVPAPHHVSQVTNFAPKGRVSLTGWFRTR